MYNFEAFENESEMKTELYPNEHVDKVFLWLNLS